MRIVFLALPALMMLSGCGLVGMVASGVSDGTKYVINRVERDPEIQARSQQGYGPAGSDTGAAVPQEQAYPNQNYPQHPIPNQTYQADPYRDSAVSGGPGRRGHGRAGSPDGAGPAGHARRTAELSASKRAA